MNKIILSILISTLSLLASQSKPDNNNTDKALKEAMEKEKKYAQEQRFYQGEEYDLSDSEVNPDSIDSMPTLEPQDDFDMDDVY